MFNFLRIVSAIALFMVTGDPLWSQVERREIGNLVIEDIPEIPERIKSRMLQYQNTRSANLRSWKADGKSMLISTRFGETTQLHMVEKPGGARKQITFFKEPIGGASISPDPSNNGFLFLKDVGGGESYQIFYYNFDDASSTLLTDGTSRNGYLNWSNKGNKFTFYSTKRNQKDWDIYITDMDNLTEAKLVHQGSGTWVAIDWSPNDKKLLLIKYISITESYLHILYIKSGKLTQVNPDAENVSYSDAFFSKNGKGLFLTTDEGSEFLRLKYYDIKKNKFKVLTGAIPWDVSQMTISKKRDKIAFVTNENGISKLYTLDTKSKKYKSIKNLPIGQIYGMRFNPDGKRLGLVINTPQTPGDIYVQSLTDGMSLERWTYSEVGGLNTESLVVPELIQYDTFDKVDGKQRQIPAFYFKPNKGEGPFPVVINIHGGPESQYKPFFSSTIQYFVNELGIAVLAPNVRGSSGYGKSYVKLDNGYKREDSVKDIGKLLDWISGQSELDAGRIVVYGGSYGGYMVLSSMTHYDDKLVGGIDVVGISNFVSFLENTKEYRRDLRRAEYGDERDPEMRAFLTKISPVTNVHKISKPLLVVQGLNDPRVPVSESEQMVEAIRNNGSPVWYLLAKDEGHGFKKKSNRDFYLNSVVLFLETYLTNN